jgi:hypothetical protein
MIDATQIVLLLGLEDAVARWVVAALAGLRVHFQRLPWSAALADPSWIFDADGIVLDHRADRAALTRLSELSGWSEKGARAGAAVALVAAERVHEVEPLRSRGIIPIVQLQGSDRRLRDVVASSLGVARRFRARMPVRLVHASESGGLEVRCTAENVSRSGMLVLSGRPLGVGSMVHFEISAPDPPGPIRGVARVVRSTDPTREHVAGFAVCFEWLLDPGDERIGAVLAGRPS